MSNEYLFQVTSYTKAFRFNFFSKMLSFGKNNVVENQYLSLIKFRDIVHRIDSPFLLDKDVENSTKKFDKREDAKTKLYLLFLS
ncbi:MAG: hypothetical protein J5I94_01930, partial [Phaeodactylibacter sp.]|nr:hypothetical protein [Phaeodactylibacter sp.]